MNKEYTYLSDKELLVANEKGHMEKREVQGNDMHEVLQLENVLTELTQYINKVEEKNKNEIKFNLPEKAFAYTAPFLITAFACGLYAIFGHGAPTDEYIGMLSVGGFLTMISDSWNIYHKQKDKKIKSAVFLRLIKAQELKDEIEERLSEIKMQAKYDAITKNNEEKYAFKPNNIVSLEDNPIYDEVVTKLDEAYQKGYSKGTKKRILKK